MPTNLHTTHAAETFNWVWDSGTDEWVKMTQPGGAGGGDGAILDGVSSAIKATVFDYTNSNPLAVRLTDTTGDYAAAGGGTEYTEDVAAPADPVGKALTVRRRDALVSEVTTDGDWIAANSTGKGEVYVKHVDAIPTTPPSNASTNVTQFGGTNLSTGTGAGGAGIPRVTVSDDSVVGIAAGSAVIGHVITDTTSTTAVTQATAANLQATTIASNTTTFLGFNASGQTLDVTVTGMATVIVTTSGVASSGVLSFTASNNNGTTFKTVRGLLLSPTAGSPAIRSSLPADGSIAGTLSFTIAGMTTFRVASSSWGAGIVIVFVSAQANSLPETHLVVLDPAFNPVPVGGIFQTSPPTLTDGQTATAQYTAAQNLKTDLTTVSGSALSLGQKTSALSVPVVLASDSAQPAAAAASTAVDTTDHDLQQQLLDETRAIRLGIQLLVDWMNPEASVVRPLPRPATSKINYQPSAEENELIEMARSLRDDEDL